MKDFRDNIPDGLINYKIGEMTEDEYSDEKMYGPNFLGKKHTEETKELMRQVDRSYTKTESFSKTMAAATTRAWKSEKMEHRVYSEEGLLKRKAQSAKNGRKSHRERIQNDWHRNGPGR